MESLKTVGAVVFSILAVSLVAFVLRGGALVSNSFFAPKEEAVRREVFENSKAFNQGTIQELSTMYREYNAPGTTESQKKAIKAVVLHQTADYAVEKLPNHLYSWVSQLRQEM